MITSIDDIFGELNGVDLSKATCHSGGALGSDSIWESESAKYGTITKSYSYKTGYHKSINKVEISEEDFKEGIDMVNKANHTLNRYGINKYINLLARNWCQVKYSSQIFAIGYIVDSGSKGSRYYNRSKYQIVDSGTGYAIQMAIDHDKEVFIFNLNDNLWYNWSSPTMSFIKCKKEPIITNSNFSGIGTRNITKEGEEAIKRILRLTQEKFNS